MTHANRDFLYSENQFTPKYSDWITFDILNIIFQDIEKHPDKTCLELFPEYKNRLNYIDRTFKLKTYGCEFHKSYKIYFEQFSDRCTNIIVNNFFQEPTKEKFDLIFFKPLLSKFQEKETLLTHIHDSLNKKGELLLIDLFLSDDTDPTISRPSNYYYMLPMQEMKALLSQNGFTIINEQNLTDNYKDNYTGDIFDNRDNQLHTPMVEIEKNIAIIHHLIAEEKVTINSIYCRKT